MERFVIVAQALQVNIAIINNPSVLGQGASSLTRQPASNNPAVPACPLQEIPAIRPPIMLQFLLVLCMRSKGESLSSRTPNIIFKLDIFMILEGRYSSKFWQLDFQT